MKKYMIRILWGMFFLFEITSCRVGPRHCIPVLEVEENWQLEDSFEGPFSDLSCSRTMEVDALFDDPLLRKYLERLRCDNNTLKIASIKVCEAYALRGISAAKLQPFIDGRIAYNSAKPAGGILTPEDGSEVDGGVLSQIPLNLKQQTFLSDFDALWEIDLFGRRQREVESATAFIQMQRASYHDLIVSLTAEFARTYLKLRREQKVLELVLEEMDILHKVIKEYDQRFNLGLDSQFFLLDSERQYEQLAAEAPFLEGEIRSLIYQLSVLLGQTPESLICELAPVQNLPEMRSEIPVGFPSELLRRRPDIRYAERQLAKSTAEVGVAVAEFFPKLTLTGNFGFQNLHLGQTRGEGEGWGYGGNLFTPLFHGGSLRANLNRYQLRRMESFIAYEEAVLKALEESESAIARFLKSQESLRSRGLAYTRSVQLMDLRQKLFEGGLSDNLQLMERKQKAIQAEREWVVALADTEIQLIALYKSLGCGWE